LASLQKQHFVAVDDRVNPVGDGKYGRVRERLLDEGLDLLFGHNVDVGSCLVEYNHLIPTQDRPGNADQLLLARAEALAAILELEVDSLAVPQIFVRVFVIVVLLGFLIVRLALEKLTKACFDAEGFNFVVRCLAARVQVKLDGAIKDDRVLRNYGNLVTKDVQANGSGFLAINRNRTATKFKDTREDQANRRFSSTRATNNANLVTRLHLETEVLQNEVKVGAVTQVYVLEHNTAFFRPGGGHLLL